MSSRKLSFVEQSTEIIIEQLRYLPIQNLLNACQANPRIADLRSIDKGGLDRFEATSFLMEVSQ